MEGDEVISVSLEIGCVRLTERFLPGDPPGAEEVAAAVAAIDAELDRAMQVIPVPEVAEGGVRLLGLAGTVTTLSQLEQGLPVYDRGRIHHAVLSYEAVARWCDVLGGERVAERARRVGLPEGRQDVIVGGALVLRQVMRKLGVVECLVSEDDILDGLVLSMRTESREQ